MTQEPDVVTRRDFLRTSVLGAALTWTVPLFIERTFSALHAEAAESSLPVATGKDHPILVVLQLAGGNDGLNAVVPYVDDLITVPWTSLFHKDFDGRIELIRSKPELLINWINPITSESLR